MGRGKLQVTTGEKKRDHFVDSKKKRRSWKGFWAWKERKGCKKKTRERGGNTWHRHRILTVEVKSKGERE